MAITWKIDTTNVNVSSGRATINFTRTDTESALAPQNYRFQNTPIDSGPERAALLNTVKGKVEEDADHDAAVDAVITDLEQTGISHLEAWEATR